MNRLFLLAVVIVLLGGLVADAKTLPVSVTGGNIKVGATRVASGTAGYDEVDFFLTGMLNSAAGLNTDGSQCRINIIAGRWTAGATGAFWVPSNAPNLSGFQSKTASVNWQTPTFSTVNFDSVTAGATVWTNQTPDPTHGLPLGGGRGPQTSGNLYNFFSGNWMTSNGDADIVYPFPKDSSGNPVQYAGNGTDSTYIAALYVTTATPDVGIGFDGAISFTYGGGTVENGHFVTTPEPATLALLGTGLVGLLAYAWRKRRQ